MALGGALLAALFGGAILAWLFGDTFEFPEGDGPQKLTTVIGIAAIYVTVLLVGVYMTYRTFAYEHRAGAKLKRPVSTVLFALLSYTLTLLLLHVGAWLRN